MTTPALTESDVEQAALAWLESVGWQTAHGPDLMPNERADYGNVILAGRLRDAIAHLNPQLPAKAWDDAFTKLTRPTGSNLVIRNRDFHRMLVNGVTVEYRTEDGAIQRPHVRFVNFDDTTTNDLLAVNQFTVTENRNTGGPTSCFSSTAYPWASLSSRIPPIRTSTSGTLGASCKLTRMNCRRGLP